MGRCWNEEEGKGIAGRTGNAGVLSSIGRGRDWNLGNKWYESKGWIYIFTTSVHSFF